MRTRKMRMRVRVVIVMTKKIAVARMKKSRQPMPNCRLIGLLKARERYDYI